MTSVISYLALLQNFFMARGYSYPDIPLLQPADPFLDTVGEDLRRQIFITHDIKGKSLCLRPEFTIPTCLAHFQSDNSYGRYAYGGSVFRQCCKGPYEFSQAGVEIIGNANTIDAASLINTREIAIGDVECLNTALDALEHCGVDRTQTIFGDKAIFEALLVALGLPQGWQERLGRAFGDSKKLVSDLRLIANGKNNNDCGEDNNDNTKLYGIPDGNNYHDALRWIRNRMTAANLPSSGGRTPAHIAERLMEKTQLKASRLSDEQWEILNEFLQMQVPVDRVTEKLREFFALASIDPGESMEIFSYRAEKLALSEHGQTGKIVWRANFGRKLDYYTGIAFEIFQPGASEPVCGGGRYDKLTGMLGAKNSMSAIGFSIWLDRLPEEATRKAK